MPKKLRSEIVKKATTKHKNKKAITPEIIKSNVNYLNGIAVGSTVKSLRKNSFENMPFYNDGKYNIIEDKLKLIHNLEEQYKKLLNEAYALKKQYLEKFFK